MTESFVRIAQFASDALSRVKVSSSLNPTIWLGSFALMAALVGEYLIGGLVGHAFLAIAFLIILLFVFQSLWFTIKDPSKLRSEEFELRHQALNLIEEKGSAIAIAETSVEALTRTEFARLPSKEGGKP